MRAKGFIWIGISYVVAFSLGFILYFLLISWQVDAVLSMFAMDVLATVIVWAFGLVFKNASFYDPYWSVAPHIMVILYMCHKSLFGIANIIFLAVFSLWSVRLTVNWALTFKSIDVEDWRYDGYRKNNPKLWHIINFFGINMMPTLLVFAGTLPALYMLETNSAFNVWTLLGALVIVLGFTLELFADIDMRKHLTSENSKSVCQVGLWKYSRHPNYLGEISVWFGVYFMLLAVNPAMFYLGVGALAILCLFVFISIPMMEKRQLQRRPEYAEYKKTTSQLLLLKNKEHK